MDSIAVIKSSGWDVKYEYNPKHGFFSKLALIANEPKDEPTQRQSVFSKMVT
jgi:hypothetical protein